MSLKKVEIELDESLIDEVMRRFHLRSKREAVNLAMRSLLGESEHRDFSPDGEDDCEDADEYSTLYALRRPGIA